MELWLWIGFIVFVLVMLALDLFVVNRKARVVSTRMAMAMTGFFIALALLFNVAVYFIYENHWLGFGLPEPGSEPSPASPVAIIDGVRAATEFFTGWLIEYSLSMDNIFVIALIFTYFRVPAQFQHRVLFWGIMGALVMRGIMIAAGAALIHQFDWIIYVFGGLLILTAIKMLRSNDDDIDPDRNLFVRLARRLYPVTRDFHAEHFFVRVDGRAAATPLFLVLLAVESTDVLFAVDSIPAIFAITQDPFLVFTSNVFAILGLRSLYFALAGLMDKFRYLKTSLVFILAFVGVKMLISHYHHIDTAVSLAVIAGILTVGILASLLNAQRGAGSDPPRGDDPPGDSAAAPAAPPACVPTAGGADYAAMAGDLATGAWRHARRVVICVLGFTAILIGLALILVPGPLTIPPIIAGLAILSLEFVWARRLLKRVKRGVQAAAAYCKGSPAEQTPALSGPNTPSEESPSEKDRSPYPTTHGPT